MNIIDFNSRAALFQLLSHPVRLQILDATRKEPCCVCHLQVLTEKPQAYISQQLKVLREAGLVVDEKEGQNVYYRLTNQTVGALLNEVLGPVGSADPLDDCTCPKCSQKNS